MKCPKCDAQAPEDKKFCAECGTPLNGKDGVEEIVAAVLREKYRTDKFIEIRIAEQVAGRLQKWAKLFLAPPLALLVVALSILGFSRWSDVDKIFSKTKAKALAASQSADRLDSQNQSLQHKSDDFQTRLNGFQASLDQKSRVLDQADDLQKRLRTTREELEARIREVGNLAAQAAHSKPAAPGELTEENEDEQLARLQTDELGLSRAATAYFQAGNYDAAIRFFRKARDIQSSGVWQSEYPYFAASYLLKGDSVMFRQTMVEMMERVDAASGYLSFKPPLSFLISSLRKVRAKAEKSPAEDLRVIDRAVDLIQTRLDRLSH